MAQRLGFFRLPPETENAQKIGWLDVAGAFALYFLVGQLLLLHLFRSAFSEKETEGWPILWSALLSALALALYNLCCTPAVRAQVWREGALLETFSQKANSFVRGAAAWLLAFPWVFFNMQLANIVNQVWHFGPPEEQVAVKLLKQSSEEPLLLLPMLFSVIFIAPWMEELLFRGFLQSWLKQSFGRFSAILLSALLFALFHYAAEQRYENAPILSSMLILGCFLGFLKEKERSLWAPIGLHVTFNLIGSFFILMVEKNV